MVTIDRPVSADLGILEPIGFLFHDEQFDIFVQAGLVALEREDVVGLSVHDLAGDLALAAHGVDGDDGALDGQHVQEMRDRHDFVRLFRHLDLAEHQTLARGESRHHVDRRFRALLLVGAP